VTGDGGERYKTRSAVVSAKPQWKNERTKLTSVTRLKKGKEGGAMRRIPYSVEGGTARVQETRRRNQAEPVVMNKVQRELLRVSSTYYVIKSKNRFLTRASGHNRTGLARSSLVNRDRAAFK